MRLGFTVKESRTNPSLLTKGGIVTAETHGTFKVVTAESVVRSEPPGPRRLTLTPLTFLPQSSRRRRPYSASLSPLTQPPARSQRRPSRRRPSSCTATRSRSARRTASRSSGSREVGRPERSWCNNVRSYQCPCPSGVSYSFPLSPRITTAIRPTTRVPHIAKAK